LSSAETEVASGEAAGDEKRQAVLDELTAELGDALVGSEMRRQDLWVRVQPEAWVRTAEVCKQLGFDYFCFLSGIDWMPHTWPNPKVAAGDGAEEEEEVEPTSTASETGYAGGDTRFQVLARVHSISRGIGILLKADLDDDNPRIATWTGVFKGADWCERETAEMYGFAFEGHPNLTKLYLPGEFEGYPLRKDFGLLAREVKPWPGLVDVEPMPGEDDGGGEDDS
jgi:NADH-quinone oxidoreductase subunit C